MKTIYLVLGILPAYGANLSFNSHGEPFTGLCAGAILAGAIYGIIFGVQYAVKRIRQ